jgi:hypothetical protein
MLDYETVSSGEIIKAVMSKVHLRDGFKISNSLVHLNENWQHAKFGEEETRGTATKLAETMDRKDFEYLVGTDKEPFVDWMKGTKYSPEKAEKMRTEARKSPKWGGFKLHNSEEVSK